MTTAWLLFASFGIFLARYFKYIMPGKKIFDLAVWFVLHRAIMIAVTLVSVGAFIAILADVGWNWIEIDEPLAFSHSIVGIVTVGLSIIQVNFLFLSNNICFDSKRKWNKFITRKKKDDRRIFETG